MAYGDVLGVQEWKFDDVLVQWPDIIHISGEVYAVISGGTIAPETGRGYIRTVTIDSEGVITPIASWQFSATRTEYPFIFHVSGDIYGFAYADSYNAQNWVKTLSIDSLGNIGPIIGSLQYLFGLCYGNRVAHVSGDVYALVYTGTGYDGYLKTVIIDSVGNISGVQDTLEFDPNTGWYPDVIRISDTIVAIAYGGPDYNCLVITVDIDAVGNIGSVQNSHELDPPSGAFYRYPAIRNIDGNVYAIAYAPAGAIGCIKTLTIVGSVIGAEISTGSFSGRWAPQFTTLDSSNICVFIASTDEGPEGVASTVSISAAGIIGSVIDTFEVDTTVGIGSDIVAISKDVVAVVYEGSGMDGWLKTLRIDMGAPTGGLLVIGMVKLLLG